MIRIIITLLLICLLSLASNLHAQNSGTDTSAVYNCIIDVGIGINPKKKPTDMKAFLTLRQQDFIYNHFTQTLADSGRFNFFPIEHLMGLKGGAKRHNYPTMMLKDARKRNKADYYIALNIEFNPSERQPSQTKSSIKSGSGILSSSKEQMGLYVDMDTKITIYDKEGKKVFETKTKTLSKNEIFFDKSEGLTIGKTSEAKVGFGNAKNEEAMVRLVQASAMSILKRFEGAASK